MHILFWKGGNQDMILFYDYFYFLFFIFWVGVQGSLGHYYILSRMHIVLENSQIELRRVCHYNQYCLMKQGMNAQEHTIQEVNVNQERKFASAILLSCLPPLSHYH